MKLKSKLTVEKWQQKVIKPKEQSIQLQVCDFIRYQYPNVLFQCDLASGMKLTMGQASKAKRMRSNSGFPDIFIAEPRGFFHGLYIELKRDGERIYKIDGTPASDHIANQIDLHRKLMAKGYDVCFAVGFDKAVSLIREYLK